MNYLEQTIDEHFLPSDKNEITRLFDKYGLFETIGQNVAQLRQQLQNALESNKRLSMPAIAVTSSHLLVGINSKVKDITDLAEKRKVQELVAKLALQILFSIIRDFKDQAVELFDTIKQALLTTCQSFGYDYNDVDQLMNLDAYQNLVDSLTGKQQAAGIVKQIPHLVWTSERSLTLLSRELKLADWIKKRKAFESLFGNADPAFSFQWNSKYQNELAHLLFRLADGHIKPVMTKGYFSIAERHIVDYSGNKFKKDFLKKTSSAINKDKEKYAAAIGKTSALLKRCWR